MGFISSPEKLKRDTLVAVVSSASPEGGITAEAPLVDGADGVRETATETGDAAVAVAAVAVTAEGCVISDRKIVYFCKVF